MKRYLITGLMLLALFGCSSPSDAIKNVDEAKASFLSLGDSYTIGESVDQQERWPVQLVSRLNEKGLPVNAPRIIAKTGWTTANLLDAMEANLNEEKFDLVSVLIGVNNQFQNKSIEGYEEDLRIIFTQAISYSKSGKDGVFVVSIPDYGVTPFGASNEAEISKEIEEFNTVCKRLATEFELDFYNITPISKKAKQDRELVAPDGLHPSGKMYRLWVDEFIEKVAVKLPN
ncbi:GDSL-type esterase/lipase family protein [Gillisia sp. M10.2A]|uniref:GDSL-type esterase/lipase family protein n=1 Tax=Gillisia lutea TaxID=2909668 RepID=A0ABS9EGJ5_9FLAO|nr:SGNH/GDSL hydrolase family protein [Gillisia lutea]MCF4100964.1 GDSL-type esterase/lipase family protein [Gillisia lutea]